MDLRESKLNFLARHPWEISRNYCLTKLVQESNPKNVLDVGSGDLYLAQTLARITGINSIWAFDNSFDINLQKVENVTCTKNIADLPNIFFDTVTFFDVLEHIENVPNFLSQLFAQIGHPEKVLISVPAFQFLFSDHDEFLLHYRRYNINQLKKEFSQFNYEIQKKFYFYSVLFIFRLIQKIIHQSKSKQIVNWQYSEKNLSTKFLVTILNTDFLINKFISKFNFLLPGLSLCMVLKKKNYHN